MTTLFDRLGYNFTPDPNTPNSIIVFSEKTQESFNTIIPTLPDWALKDLKDSNVDGYVKNNMYPIANETIITLNTFIENLNVQYYTCNVLNVPITQNTINTTNVDSNNNIIYSIGGQYFVQSMNTVNLINGTSNDIIFIPNGPKIYTDVDGNPIIEANTMLPNNKAKFPANSGNYALAITQITSEKDYLTSCVTSTTQFIDHTNKMSGVTPLEQITDGSPHYNTAMAYSKMCINLVAQADGGNTITNNQIMMGSFTSLIIENEANNFNKTIISSNIYCPLNIATISNLINLYNTRKNHDVNYFNNMKSLMNDYNKVQMYSSYGETESNLLNNFIGTEKLLSRINANN